MSWSVDDCMAWRDPIRDRPPTGGCVCRVFSWGTPARRACSAIPAHGRAMACGLGVQTFEAGLLTYSGQSWPSSCTGKGITHPPRTRAAWTTEVHPNQDHDTATRRDRQGERIPLRRLGWCPNGVSVASSPVRSVRGTAGPRASWAIRTTAARSPSGSDPSGAWSCSPTLQRSNG